MPDIRELEARVLPHARLTAARLALLGDDDERLSTCEVLRGITDSADFRLVSDRTRGRAGSKGTVRAR
ncbi:hypothetical protein L6E12_21770 [Actinokineospora sp. PR83]|uniref:hypothetical protein n=1 Tax=Actinokineospora sp. PR83 TaxID=2884908 RepID=UPI001F1F1B5C|nr:hypothetical protein [Actinokineospora sp. PR83]MCG8918415.1 hypothetical protein [Actinokineospora sp. PR83]